MMTMTKEKQPPPPREDQPPERKPGWSPADDLYGDASKPVDTDLDLGNGTFSKPPPK